MNDPVFGTLNYEFGWNGKVSINFNDEKYDIFLFVNAEEDVEPSELQRQAYCEFMKKYPAMQEEILDIIEGYYESLMDEEGFEGNGKSAAELIEPTAINIPYDDIYDGRCVFLCFDCAWDEENGMAIMFIDEKISEVGQQDIAF